MNALGDREACLLVNRRCSRCGMPVFASPDSFPGLFDSIVETYCGKRLFPGFDIVPLVCESCFRVEKKHLYDDFKRKTK